MVRVSVIVPIYNVYEYLDKCLSCLAKQSLKDIEIILVNDGSEDDSQSIVSKYVEKYPQMKSYIKKNGGLSDARNYGIKRASGEYICFVDSDDYIDEFMLEKMYNYAKDNNLDMVICDNIKVYPDNRYEYLKVSLMDSSDISKKYLLSCPMAAGRIYKRELFSYVKFKKGIYYEDLELTPRLINYTNKIGFLNEGLYYYVQREGSIMYQKEFNSKLLDIFDVLDTNKKYLYSEYPLEIEYMYITHLLRSATLRFLDYKDTDVYLDKIVDIIKKEFPNWKDNIYFKKSSFKLKLICILGYYKKRRVLRLIKRLTGR